MTNDDSQAEPTDESGEDQDSHVDDLVGGLFRDVDDRFSDLAARFQAARQDLTPAEVEASLATPDPIAASEQRYQLVSEVATLRADVERQAGELDERDRMLAELSGRIIEFEDRLRIADDAERAAAGVRQELHEERRELARIRALLEASAAEREELVDVAQRLKTERDHLEDRLAIAASRFDEVEGVRTELVEDVARLESARQAETLSHEARFDELAELKVEARRLSELVDELTTTRDEASSRADKAESKNERRGNEVNYLNRRIESLSERANEAERLDAQVTQLSEENTLLARRAEDLNRELETQTAQAVASAAAVEAIADRSAQHDELIDRIAELEAAAARRKETTQAVAASSELQDLASRARALGSQRTAGNYQPLASGQAAAPPPPEVQAPLTPAEPAAHEDAVAATSAPAGPPPIQAPRIEAPQIHIPEIAPPQPVAPEIQPPAPAAQFEAPRYEAPVPAAAPQFEIAPPAPAAPPTPVAPPAAPQIDLAPATPPAPAAPPAPIASGPPPAAADIAFGGGGTRRRMVLPSNMEPDTPEAVGHLLGQPGVTAIVDARSFCSRTNVRPSELFARIEALRDRFDVPVEVVVTPVSTPVGGIPRLPAIGVHSVTGADTVADRVRALCIGFPTDQPLVVIAGDDHVRRAAIGEEANVVDPAVVIAVT